MDTGELSAAAEGFIGENRAVWAVYLTTRRGFPECNTCGYFTGDDNF